VGSFPQETRRTKKPPICIGLKDRNKAIALREFLKPNKYLLFLYYMRIIGIDVGRGSAVLCCLDKFPDNIQQLYRTLLQAQEFHYVKCDGGGVEKLLSLDPEGIVIEPTGHWYSHFWATVAYKYNIEVFWLGNSDLDKFRGNLGFVNKRDEEDALCLAASYFDDRFVHRDGSKRFLKYYYNHNLIISQIRENFHEKEQLQKIRASLVAQLRQRLAYEYPEAVSSTLTISKVRGFTPFLGWLAQQHLSTLQENKYKRSIAHSLGIEISQFSRDHAVTITSLEQRISNCNAWFLEISQFPEFDKYHKVFDRFGFGLNLKMLLLYHCYPFDKYLVEAKPWIEREPGKNGKLQKRDRSLRKFQAYLGMGYKFKQSGDYLGKSFGGSTIVRSHLYIWAVCMIAPQRGKIKGKIGKQLCDRYQELRKTVKGKDALIRILFLTTRLLYREFVKEFSD
jgi:hypothetical protein